MFNRLSSFFAQAAEVTTQALTGQQRREEELQSHWKTIQEILVSDKGETDVSAVQDIDHHLDYISDLICDEEEERKDNVGPCLEFMLRHKLLAMLVTTAKTDYPAGMRKTVLKFLTVLLGRIDEQLLPHVAVHRPVNQLIKTCGLSSNNPLAAEELMFLRILCVKLQQDATLVNFFIEEKQGDNIIKFVISEAFMKITISEDSLVCIKAFECLLVCVSLPNSIITQSIANSQFPILLSSKLKQHLQLVPNTLHYTDIINCRAGWGVNNASTSAVQCLSPSPQNPLLHLEAYFSWLDYCDQVVAAAPKLLQDVVCTNIKDHVIVGVLQQKLTLSSEPDLVVGVAIIIQTMNLITHERLKQEFIDYILTSFWDLLLQCCNHFNDDVCCSSLLLLHSLLSLPSLLPRVIPVTTHPTRHVITDTIQLEQLIEKYLSIVPTNCLSANTVDYDSGLTLYLLEAQSQLQKCQQLTDSFVELTTPTKWEEPPVITVLLDRLERLLDQNYYVNLQVTAIVSHIASLLPSSLDQYIFIPSSISDAATCRTVYGALNKVKDQLVIHTGRSPGLNLNIMEARSRLHGQETSDLLSMPNNELLEGAVVLEEFTKELAAILFVKYSNVLSMQSTTVSQEIDAL